MTNKAARQYLAKIGTKGGKVKGRAKVRGDAEHYRKLSAASWAKRRGRTQQP